MEQVVNPDGSQVGYKYDPAGNRVEMRLVEGNYTATTKYEYNEVNELTKLSVNNGPYTEFQYDRNGNRTAKIEPDNVVTSYLWDYENRLTEVRFHQGKRVGFEYDGDGNRITKLSAMSLPTYKNNDGNDGENSGENGGGNSGENGKDKYKPGGNGEDNSGGNAGVNRAVRVNPISLITAKRNAIAINQIIKT